jgi:hypothetical protein
LTCFQFSGLREAEIFYFRIGLEDGGFLMKRSKFSEAQVAFALRQVEEGRDQRNDLLCLPQEIR